MKPPESERLDAHASNFDEAVLHEPSLELLRAIIQLTRSHFELWAEWPTATQLRDYFKKPP